MKNKWNNILGNLLMDAVTDTGGAGGGTSNSFITPGGGTVPPTAGNANPTQGTTIVQTPNDTTITPNTQGNAASDWRSQLPKELQDDANIKKFTDVSSLAKSFVNAQKLIGVDKIPVPGKYTTPEEWTQIYRKLGVPEKIDDYAVKFKEGVSIDDKFSAGFKELAHKSGIHPMQAQALADWFSEANMTAEQELAKQMDTQFKKNLADLKAEFGNSFDLQIARANKVVNEIGGKDLALQLNNTGMGADKSMIKFLAKVGETIYGEDKFVENQDSVSVLDPKALDSEIAKIQSNPAYSDKNHPMQKLLVQEMSDLMAQKYGKK